MFPHAIRCAPIALILILLILTTNELEAQTPDVSERHLRALEFHVRSMQPTGLLVPMYIYPADIHTNASYNRVIEVKRSHPTIPFVVILNPASGPGPSVDANYTKAIDRLQGAGCVTIGYVSTRYGQQSVDQVKKELETWIRFYPRVQGVFFDEMIYEDNDRGSRYQATLNAFAKFKGLWPTVANPGAPTPERYFANSAADVIVIHEANQWPDEKSIHGDYFGGYADYPTFSRAALMYGIDKLDQAKLSMVQKYVRWIYVTHDPYTPNDPKAPNPWDELSVHLEELCKAIEAD